MKITKYGTMTFVEGQGPRVEGWLVERESEDPADATMEQLLLAFVIHWAKEKFQAATTIAVNQGFKDAVQKAQRNRSQEN